MNNGIERAEDVQEARTSNHSAVVLVNGDVAPPPQSPSIVNNMPSVHINQITKSDRIHIGTKILSINQTVKNTEGIKSRILGLELVSQSSSRELRCSVAVFVCWTLIVVAALVTILFIVILPKSQTKLDIELPFLVYLWNHVKDTTRAERLFCAAALLALIVAIALVIYFTAFTHTHGEPDISKDDWYITRERWLSKDYNTSSNSTTAAYEPLNLVIIDNTVGPECFNYAKCAAEMRNLQNYYIEKKKYDLPYNFIVGNDGRVYEARGWVYAGAHTKIYNLCSLSVSFMGDYRKEENVHSEVSALQVNRTMMILEEGVRLGHLSHDYRILGGKDLRSTESPGSNLYNEIKTWDRYDHELVIKNKTCAQIHDLFAKIKI